MPPRRKRNPAEPPRSWRRGSEPGRSVLSQGAPVHIAGAQPVLAALQEKVEPSPLYQIPMLRPWLAARELMLWDGTERRRAG
jgi:hypothetical protein